MDIPDDVRCLDESQIQLAALYFSLLNLATSVIHLFPKITNYTVHHLPSSLPAPSLSPRARFIKMLKQPSRGIKSVGHS